MKRATMLACSVCLIGMTMISACMMSQKHPESMVSQGDLESMTVQAGQNAIPNNQQKINYDTQVYRINDVYLSSLTLKQSIDDHCNQRKMNGFTIISVSVQVLEMKGKDKADFLIVITGKHTF